MLDTPVKKVKWRVCRRMVALALPVLVYIAILRSGIRTYTVLSGSMEPAIRTGTLLFVHSVEPEKLKTDDVITFHVGENMTATHRIVDIHKNTDGLWFQTKGDANAAVDGKLTHESKVIGRPVISIPGAGYLIWYLQKNIVSTLLILFGSGGVFLFAISGIASERKADTKKGKHLRS